MDTSLFSHRPHELLSLDVLGMLAEFWATHIGGIEKMNIVKAFKIYMKILILVPTHGIFVRPERREWIYIYKLPPSLYLCNLTQGPQIKQMSRSSSNSRYVLHHQHQVTGPLQALQKAIGHFFFKILNIKLSYHMAIPLQGIHPRETKHISRQRLAQKGSRQHYN